MLDFERMLQRALKHCGQAPVTIAMPYDLPQRFLEPHLTHGRVRGVVADAVDQASVSPRCAGWWVDRERGHLSLRSRMVDTLVLVGVDTRYRVGPRLLLEARLKGVSRVVAIDRSGDPVEDLCVAQALLERVDAGSARAWMPDYAAAFDDMYERVGDRLRLPDSAFSADRLVLAIGTLGPGGAERQGAYTAGGAIGRGGLQTYVVCEHLEPPADFFRPYVESRGATVLLVPSSPPELADPELRAIHQQLDEDYRGLGFGDIFIQIVRYASLLRAIRPAVVHSWMDYCNVLCGSAAALVGVPGLLLGCRSMAPDHFHIFQPYMRAGYRSLIGRRPALMLNNSRAGAADYARWLRIDGLMPDVIHNGFEFPDAAAQTRASARAALGFGDGHRVIGSMLRFSEEKRPELLVDAAAIMHGRDANCRFVFYGTGALLETVRAKVRAAGLTDVVLLPGVTDAAWEALSAMDLFMLASRMEGLPNVMVEAQALGVPVVCTGVGGMTETFINGQTGVAVPEATAEALAAAAADILDDAHVHRSMAARAREHARNHFGIARMVDETLAAYRRARDAYPTHQPRMAA